MELSLQGIAGLLVGIHGPLPIQEIAQPIPACPRSAAHRECRVGTAIRVHGKGKACAGRWRRQLPGSGQRNVDRQGFHPLSEGRVLARQRAETARQLLLAQQGVAGVHEQRYRQDPAQVFPLARLVIARRLRRADAGHRMAAHDGGDDLARIPGDHQQGLAQPGQLIVESRQALQQEAPALAAHPDGVEPAGVVLQAVQAQQALPRAVLQQAGVVLQAQVGLEPVQLATAARSVATSPALHVSPPAWHRASCPGSRRDDSGPGR